LLDAPARPGREPADDAGRLGARRPLLLPADRLLAPASERDRGGEEGVRHECRRRRDVRARALPAREPDGNARPRPAPERPAEPRGQELVGDQPDRARVARRSGREVGPATAPDLTPRRDEGAYAN